MIERIRNIPFKKTYFETFSDGLKIYIPITLKNRTRFYENLEKILEYLNEEDKNLARFMEIFNELEEVL